MADFSEAKIQQVWEKSRTDAKYDENKYRFDDCAAIMQRDLYGKTDSIYGWTIDHIIPLSKGGSNDLSNLRPMQHQNNAAKADNNLLCIVKFNFDENMNVKI